MDGGRRAEVLSNEGSGFDMLRRGFGRYIRVIECLKRKFKSWKIRFSNVGSDVENQNLQKRRT